MHAGCAVDFGVPAAGVVAEFDGRDRGFHHERTNKCQQPADLCSPIRHRLPDCVRAVYHGHDVRRGIA